MKRPLQYLGHFLKDNPYDAIAWCYQGISLAALGQFEKAVMAFDKTVEINQQCAPAFYGKGNSLTHLGRYQDAVSSYNRALELEPDNYKTHFRKGTALIKLQTV